MDNFKNLETDTNNSGELSPTSVPGVPNANIADVPEDATMKDDEALFGEPISQDQEMKEALPQSLNEDSEVQQTVEKEPEHAFGQEQQIDHEFLRVEEQQKDQEPPQDSKDIELPSAETGLQEESRIEDNSGKTEEDKPAEINPQDGVVPNVAVKNEESDNVSDARDKDDKMDVVENGNGNENKNEDQKEHNDGDGGNDINNNNKNSNNNDSNNINDNNNNNGNDNGVNDNTDKNEEELPEGLESRSERKESQDSQKRPENLSTTHAAAETPATTTTSKAASDDNDLAVPQSHEIVIPSYAGWFNLTKIHPIERQSLPEFFTNRIPSKTPQVYVKCRNFMVNSYRLNPNEYFTVTTARRNVCGDAAAVFRIHKFLMKWGLINYQVDAQVLPKSVEPPFTGEYSTRHDAPRGLFPFESYKPSVQLPDMAKLKKMMDVDDTNSTLHKYLKEEERKSRSAVSSNHEVKDEDEEKADSSENNREEEPVENPHGAKRPKVVKESTKIDDGWQENEVEKLLKAIQTYGSEWYKIAKEVGNKTPEQCILKFIQMPIEDKFLHQGGENGSDLGALKYAPHLPFSKSENPVMSTLAFLVGLADPKVVQNMTDRALKTSEPKEEGKDSSSSLASPPSTKDASELAIASLGARSHVFANNEERLMTSIAHQMAQIQLQKVEVKLKMLDQVEKSLELEKKTLQRQQEDVLIQRISFAKHTKNISQKLEESLNCFDDKEKFTSYVNEIKNLVSHPPKLSIGSAFTNDGMTTGSGISADKLQEELQPVSVEAPRSYRYWSA